MGRSGRPWSIVLVSFTVAALGLTVNEARVGGAVSLVRISPPATIVDDCSSDATAALNAFFASVPAGSTIALPANACYLVSNGPTTLRLNGLSRLTIDGNGATLEQKTYAGGVCGDDMVQPVLQLTSDTNLTFNDLEITGPHTCGGSQSEGDYGIELGQATPGNSNITFDDVNVWSVDGDGLAVLPQLGTCCGINTNITFENGSMAYIGYHVFTPEGVNGLNILNNQFAYDGNFMDMEVDADGPGFVSPVTGVAELNVNIWGNTFSQRAGLSIDSLQGACIPQADITIVGNTVRPDGSGISMLLGGSGSPWCGGRDFNLTIQNNVSLAQAGSPCGGSIATPPACSMIEIADYANVTMIGNWFTAFDGTPTYFPNTIYIPCITLQGVETATIERNVCADAWDVWDTTNWQFQATGFPATSGVTACGNVYGLMMPIAPAGGQRPSVAPLLDPSCS
jgi:hypothetical protein